MMPKGPELYDQKVFFEKYMERRNSAENANDTIEKPIFQEMLGDIEGQSILDLGCGMGDFGKELLAEKALDYTGVDGSENMIKLAKENLKDEKAEIIGATLENWEFPVLKYDRVISRLVLHYIEDINELFGKIYQTLKPGGAFVFSIEHPVMTSSYGIKKPEGKKQDWTVDQYFHSGERKQEWLDTSVRKFHRTIEEHFISMQTAGFIVEQIRESKPKRENFINQETYDRRMRIPLFLFMKGRKE